MIEDVDIHPRIFERHPELSEDDVRDAWASCFVSAPRLNRDRLEFISIGLDSNFRNVEMISRQQADESWLIYHAQTPPSEKVLKELGLLKRGKK